ncbi:MAG: hypothetical protein Q9181_005054 [Wetmoreana brouardii]
MKAAEYTYHLSLAVHHRPLYLDVLAKWISQSTANSSNGMHNIMMDDNHNHNNNIMDNKKKSSSNSSNNDIPNDTIHIPLSQTHQPMPPSYINPSDDDTIINPPRPGNDALLQMPVRDILPPQPQSGDFDSDLDNGPKSETSSQRDPSPEPFDDGLNVPYLDLQGNDNNSDADSLSVSLKDDDEATKEGDESRPLPNLWRLLASDPGYDADAERNTSMTRYPSWRRHALRFSWSRCGFNSEWPDFVAEAYNDGQWIHDNVLDVEGEGKVEVLFNGARRDLKRFFKGEMELDRKDEEYERENRERVEDWLGKGGAPGVVGQLGSLLRNHYEVFEKMDSLAPAEGRTEITLEEAAEILNQALDNDDHSYWKHFGADFSPYGNSSTEDVKIFRQMIQVRDDEDRKEQGLEPRPWTEIAKEHEVESMQYLRDFDKNVLEWDSEQRRKKGLEPRSANDIKAQFHPQYESCAELMKAVALKCDALERKKKGLEPRSWEEFQHAVWVAELPLDTSA